MARQGHTASVARNMSDAEMFAEIASLELTGMTEHGWHGALYTALLAERFSRPAVGADVVTPTLAQMDAVAIARAVAPAETAVSAGIPL